MRTTSRNVLHALLGRAKYALIQLLIGIRNEIRESPIQVFLAVIGLFTAVNWVYSFVEERINPPLTQVEVTPIHIKPDANRRIIGDVQFVPQGYNPFDEAHNGPVPVEHISGYVVIQNKDNSVHVLKSFTVPGPISISSARSVRLFFDSMPARLQFCLSVKNIKGGSATQKVLLEPYSYSDIDEKIVQEVGQAYVQIPDNEARSVQDCTYNRTPS